MDDPQAALTAVLVDIEESKIDWGRMGDDDYEPPGLSCADGPAILSGLAARGFVVARVVPPRNEDT